MDKDRTKINEIISEMLENPKNGIYPTATAYTKLELYIESERLRTIGWALGYVCIELERGNDPRLQNIPDLIGKAMKDLATEQIRS